ncbi:MAG: hypothetical protein OXT74_17795 [Candidatus Poribacteria bacterium]|nr:hypothetical protein [Candidatus Poribacteria bacterium]
MRRQVPLVLCFLFGIVMMLVEFSPHPFSEGLRAELINWSLIIGPFALVIGVVTLVHTHVIRIKRRVEHWQYSYLVFIGMIVMVAFGLPTGPKNEVFEWLFDNVQVPMEATMFSLLAFFIASASYRAFRARTLEATLLLVAALIVMIGNAPIGDLLWNELSPVGENIPSTARQWILDNPNLSSRRGIILGVSLGVISQSIRIIFGIERSYLGGGD